MAKPRNGGRNGGKNGDNSPVSRHDLREAVAELRGEVHVGFVEVSKRLDNLIRLLGDRYRGVTPQPGQVVRYHLSAGAWHPAVVVRVHRSDDLDLEVFGIDPGTGRRFPEHVHPGDGPGCWQQPE